MNLEQRPKEGVARESAEADGTRATAEVNSLTFLSAEASVTQIEKYRTAPLANLVDL